MPQATVLVATGNPHKASELGALLGEHFTLALPEEWAPVEETATTLWGNARLKARYLFEQYQKPVIADDSGIFVSALGGAPGVRSARFAGENASDADNNNLLLRKLEGAADRSAYFACALTFIDKGRTLSVMGQIRGAIADKPCGNEGFGYDPVFIPEGETATMAQLGADFKNIRSHRAAAARQLGELLGEFWL